MPRVHAFKARKTGVWPLDKGLVRGMQIKRGTIRAGGVGRGVRGAGREDLELT